MSIIKNIAVKICSYCKQEKPVTEFYKRSKTKNKFRYICKNCNKMPSLQWRFKNPEKNKQNRKISGKKWRQNNPKKVKQSKERYYLKHHDKILQRQNQNRLNNRKKYREYEIKYEINHRDKINQRRKRHLKIDICFKIACNYRVRVWSAVRGFCKSAHTEMLLMCSIPEFKLHIESLWLPGMTWDNYGYGKNKWHIDHIIPCSFFNMLDPVEQYMCFRWQNCQPMWQTDNFKKGSKIIIKH